MIMKVYHRDSLPHPLDLNHCRNPGWPRLYTHVADVEASGLEEAFRLTNSLERPWWENEEITLKTEPPLRSTSVGDVIVDGGGPKLCLAVGWRDLQKETKVT